MGQALLMCSRAWPASFTWALFSALSLSSVHPHSHLVILNICVPGEGNGCSRLGILYSIFRETQDQNFHSTDRLEVREGL